MSTILDALRKAQEETGSGREVRADKVPVSGEPPSPRGQGPRRLFGWLAVVLGVLAVAFVGGLALGNRVSDLFGGAGSDRTEGAHAPNVAAVAPAPEIAPAPESAPVAPGGPARAENEQASGADEPPTRVAAAPPQAKRAAATAARAEDPPVPTPYGQLHVFGAGERPSNGRSGAEDRAARLQQLRERMLKQRREAAGKGGAARSEQAAVPIIVPPPPGKAPEQQPAQPDSEIASANAARAAASAAARARPAVAGGDGARQIVQEHVEEAAVPEPEVVAAAPVGADKPATDQPPRAAAVGVAVGNAHDEQAGGATRDPDIDMPGDDPRPVPDPQAPTEIASLPPPPAEAAPARPAGEPPVLRRSPGGAPQVSINILQWSTEPGRRFAFVSVDGGGMTQVREGDRIGGLTVKHIHEQMIEFGFNESSFLLRAN